MQSYCEIERALFGVQAVGCISWAQQLHRMMVVIQCNCRAVSRIMKSGRGHVGKINVG